MRRRRAVFLDRDGTLSVERADWVRSPADVRLLPGAGRAVRAFNDAGFLVIVVTNQSAVARGFIAEADLGPIHRELARRLARSGARVDAVYYCPHHPQARVARYRRRCRCRKPGTGMLERALREHPIELRGSLLIGDDVRDLELTRGSPLVPILVRTGKGRTVEAEARRRFGKGLLVVDGIGAAAAAALGGAKGERGRRHG